jgi:hypothetical protein
MHEAVALIVGAAAINALPLGLAPRRSGTDFVDPAHVTRSPTFRLSLLGLPELPDLDADRIGAT